MRRQSRGSYASFIRSPYTIHRGRLPYPPRDNAALIGWAECNGNSRALAVRRPVPLLKPDAIFRRHLGALRRRRATFAGRGFLAVFRGPPAQFDAVIRVVGHLEIGGACEHVLEGQCPRRAVAAGI